MNELFSIVSAFLVSILLANVIRSYALARGLIDNPNYRSSHIQPTPRGGGAAIVVTFLTLLVVAYFLIGMPNRVLLAFVLGGGLVSIIGFVDDHRHVPARYRLIVHFAAAGLVLYLVGGLENIQVGVYLIELGWVGNAMAVLLLVWMVNLFNFMDGIDGIAATETIFVVVAATIISAADSQGYSDILRFGLAASCGGFLILNWAPAKIFLGDVGSGYLGITVGTLAAISINTGELPLWSWLILTGVFIVDATSTLLQRAIRGEKWYEAHCSHAYQRAAQRLKSHATVTMLMSAINILWLLPLAWFSAQRPEFGWWLTLLAWTPLVGLTLAFAADREEID